MKTFLIIILFLLYASTSFSQSSWFWQNPYPQGNIINDIFFVNKNVGWASTGSNYMKTTDGGINWQIFPKHNDYSYEGFYFFNENTGFAGNGGNICKTTNGGIKWDTINKSINIGRILDIYFINSTTGIILGTDGIGKTTNNGVNWYQKNNSMYVFEGSIIFSNSKTGFVTSAYLGKYYKTTNAGDNWYRVDSISNFYLHTMCFPDSLTGYIFGESNNCLKTTNGGLNWFTQLINPNRSLEINACYFKDVNTGWIGYAGLTGLAKGAIFKTTNGGLNWDSTGLKSCIYEMFAIDTTTIIAGGMGLVKTTNGSNWNYLSSGMVNSFRSICFVNESTGFVMGGSVTYASEAPLLRTTNAGDNWYIINTNAQGAILSMSFMNNTTGFLVGDYTLIRKTTNTGLNWFDINFPDNVALKYIYCKDTNTIWLTTYDPTSFYGSIYKSTNQGNNWIKNFTNWRLRVESVFFLNNNTGWAVGGEGSYQELIYKTTNGGNNWQLIDINFEDILERCYFVNENTGWACGGRGSIFKSTNGGLNWQLQFRVEMEIALIIFFLLTIPQDGQ